MTKKGTVIKNLTDEYYLLLLLPEGGPQIVDGLIDRIEDGLADLAANLLVDEFYVATGKRQTTSRSLRPSAKSSAFSPKRYTCVPSASKSA